MLYKFVGLEVYNQLRKTQVQIFCEVRIRLYSYSSVSFDSFLLLLLCYFCIYYRFTLRQTYSSVLSSADMQSYYISLEG